MENLVPLGTGNSRLMKSNIPTSTTLAQLIQMLNNGTFPYDIGPLNPAGISQQGTPLNKATLFSDDTAALYPEGVNNPNDALEYLRKYGAGATATYPAAIDIEAGDVCDVVDGEASASIVAEPGEENPIEANTNCSDLARLNDDYSILIYSTSTQCLGCLVDNKTGAKVGVSFLLMSTKSNYMSVARLSDEKFAFCFTEDGSGASYPFANIGTVSGTSVTLGTSGVYAAYSASKSVCVVPFTDTHALVLYQTDNQLNANVFYVSNNGSVGFSGHTGIFGSGAIDPYSITGILLPDDSSEYYKILCVYRDRLQSWNVFSVVVQVSKTSPTSNPVFGNKTQLTSYTDSSSQFGICLLNDGKVLVSCCDNTDNKKVHIIKLAVSGTTITKELDVGTDDTSNYSSLINTGSGIILGTNKFLYFVDDITLSVSGAYGYVTTSSRSKCVSVSKSSILISYMHSSFYTQIATIHGRQIGGKFTTSSTQAIALNSASPGEDVRLLFGGSATLPGATAGTEIVSDGIIGEVPIDGMVTALSKGIRNKLTQIYTGSYTGTGQYGSSNPNTLTFPFEPKILVVGNYWQFTAPYGCPSAPCMGDSNSVGGVNLNWSGNSVSWYSTRSDTSQLNESGKTYNYFAIG